MTSLELLLQRGTVTELHHSVLNMPLCPYHSKSSDKSH